MCRSCVRTIYAIVTYYFSDKKCSREKDWVERWRNVVCINYQCRLQTAQSRQKSYADKRRSDIEFLVGDMVLQKVLSWKNCHPVQETGQAGPQVHRTVRGLTRVTCSIHWSLFSGKGHGKPVFCSQFPLDGLDQGGSVRKVIERP